MQVPCAPPPVLAIAARTPPAQRSWTRVPAGVSRRSRVAMSIKVPIEPSEEGAGHPEARFGTGVASSSARCGPAASPAPGLASPPPASVTGSRHTVATARESPMRGSVAAKMASASTTGDAAASHAPAPASGAPVLAARAAAAQNERTRIFDVIAAAQAQYELARGADEKGADCPDSSSVAESVASGQASGGISVRPARGSTTCGATTAAALAASRRRQRRLGAAGASSSSALRNPGQPLIPSQLLAKARPVARAVSEGSG